MVCRVYRAAVVGTPARALRTCRTARGFGGEMADITTLIPDDPDELARVWGALAGQGVRWLEESVSSDDLEGLRLLTEHGPAGMTIAAGEYFHDVTGQVVDRRV